LLPIRRANLTARRFASVTTSRTSCGLQGLPWWGRTKHLPGAFDHRRRGMGVSVAWASAWHGRHRGMGRNAWDGVRGNRHAVFGLDDRHLRLPADQFGRDAFVAGSRDPFVALISVCNLSSIRSDCKSFAAAGKTDRII
jgi:hypothetical protein